jgi:hypothetical protein
VVPAYGRAVTLGLFGTDSVLMERTAGAKRHPAGTVPVAQHRPSTAGRGAPTSCHTCPRASAAVRWGTGDVKGAWCVVTLL